MQMRITTGGVLKGYKSNLMKSFIASNNARIKVLTQRNFNSYAENPAAATQAFQLRYSFWRTDSQLTASQHVINQYEGAYKALDQVAEKVKNSTENSSNAAILRGLNDPTGEGREALGTELKQLAESIVQSMNTKYADDFIFAGADGLNVPFSWAEDGKTLLYRGIPVDTKVPEEEYDPQNFDYYTYKDPTTNQDVITADQTTIPATAAYNKITVQINGDGTFGEATKEEVPAGGTPAGTNITPVTVESNTLEDAFKKFLKEQDPTANITGSAKELAKEYVKAKDADGQPNNQAAIDEAKEDIAKLEYLADEALYVDIGLGFQEDENGNLIGASAFNAALPGLNYIGYGVDEDGDPKNLASLSYRLGELLSSCKDGTWPDTATQEEATRLQLKLKKACDEFTNEYTQLTTRADFLKQNHTQLTDTAYTINEQLDTIEKMDLADAITSFSWAMYSYNAALKVGNSILSQSLMDYMN